MLSYIPKPYPDELLYSVVARLGVHLRLNGNNLIGILFGPSRKAIVDLPMSIDNFAKTTSPLWKLSSDQIIDRYTLLPIYSYFISENRSMFVRETMKSNNKTYSGFANLTYSSGLNRPKFLRFCPQCLASDMETYGESYWRRAHQIPGILLCSRHSSPLIESEALYRPHQRSKFVDASENLKLQQHESTINTTKWSDTLVDIAKYCFDLLQNEPNVLKFDISGDAYRQGGFNLGFYKDKNKLNINELEDAFVNFYGEATLAAMGVSIVKNGKSNWLQRIFRKHTNMFQPIQHVLVHLFLEDAGEKSHFVTPPFGSGPWKFPTSDLVANKQNTPKLLSEAQIQANRVKWIKLFNIAQSKTGAKKLNESLYKQLCTHDKMWFESCQKKIRSQVGVDKIDWEKRDELLSNEIYHVAAILYNKSTPVWVTKSLIAAQISRTSIFSKSYLSKLPACREAISVSVETIDDCYERKIQHAKNKILIENLPLKRGLILKLAGINRPPYSPRTEAAIMNALAVDF